MITIYTIGLLTSHLKLDNVKYGYKAGSLAKTYGVKDISKLSEKKQLDVFFEIDSNNGGIITMPHGDSFFRKTFIEKLLTEKGFIDEKYIGVPLHTNIDGEDVVYKIVDYIKKDKYGKV